MCSLFCSLQHSNCSTHVPLITHILSHTPFRMGQQIQTIMNDLHTQNHKMKAQTSGPKPAEETVPGQNVGRKQLCRQRKRDREKGGEGFLGWIRSTSLLSQHICFLKPPPVWQSPLDYTDWRKPELVFGHSFREDVVEVPSTELLAGSRILRQHCIIRVLLWRRKKRQMTPFYKVAAHKLLLAVFANILVIGMWRKPHRLALKEGLETEEQKSTETWISERPSRTRTHIQNTVYN